MCASGAWWAATRLGLLQACSYFHLCNVGGFDFVLFGFKVDNINGGVGECACYDYVNASIRLQSKPGFPESKLYGTQWDVLLCKHA